MGKVFFMRSVALRVGLGVLLLLSFSPSWAQEEGRPSLPPAPTTSSSSPPAPREESSTQEAVRVGPKEVLQIVASAKWSVDLYLPLVTYKDLASVVATLAKEKKVRVRIIAEERALSLPSTYLHSLALLGLRYPVQVRVVATTPGVDPRAIVDRTHLIVGGGLEGVDSLISPTLLFRDPSYAEKELSRFERTWRFAPYCRPQARYNRISGRVALDCELLR